MARNKSRDVIADYYKTNREIEKENDERIRKEGKKKSWSTIEKVMTVVIALCVVGIVIRYVVLR